MKKVRNLEDLEGLIGRESIERCFMEYILTVIGQAKRSESLQAGCAVMEEEEMEHFIGKIGKKDLKTVCSTLVALGYSREWVSGPLKEAFEKRYQW